MIVLLDSHVLLWALSAPERLAPAVHAIIAEPSNTIYFSSASIWEIAVKSALGRPDFAFEPEQVTAAAVQTGFRELAVTSRHAAMVAKLPRLHRDPFDRLLVAQAIALPAKFFTCDEILAGYSELVELIDRG